MGIWAGFTHTSGGVLCPFSDSSIPVTICRHLGAKVIFPLALTSQVRFWSVVGSWWELPETARLYAASSVDRVGAVSLFILNEGSECCALCARVTMYAGRFADVRKRHLTTTKVNFGTRPFHEVGAY